MTDSPRKSRTPGLLRDSAIGSVLIAQPTVIVPAIFPDGRAEAAGSNVTARVAVNVRSGPGTDHSRIGVLYPGESLSIRGSAANDWVPVTWHGWNTWVASAYVTGWDIGKKSFSTGEEDFAWTRIKLNARSPPSLSTGIRKLLDKDTRVSLTGQVLGQWNQIDLNGDTAWVAIRYLDSFTPEQTMPTLDSASIPATSALETIGPHWGSTGLSLWTAARGDRPAGVAPRDTELKVTGTVSGGYAQVVWKDTVRWVTTRHLTDNAPTKSSASSDGETCLTSLYSDDSVTASGEPFNQWAMKTAHKTLPLGTRLRVTNPANGRTVEVAVNDHDPYVVDRYLDLTTDASKTIADARQGAAEVSYEAIS